MLKALIVLTTAAAIAASAQKLPRVDLHAHIDGETAAEKKLPVGDVVALGKKLNVRIGVLGEGGCGGEIHDNETLGEFIKELEGAPVYRGLQVYGFDWPKCLSPELRAKLDYLSADALVFPYRGKDVWLWTPNAQFTDTEDFMERYVEFNVQVLKQPIQVWANPTYIPESLKARYDELWTPARMDRVIDAVVKNNVAIEINTHFKIPSKAFILRAKARGAKFSFGSNAHIHGIGEIDWPLQMAQECGLTAKDIYVPARKLK